MPTYEYACTECGDRLEVVQRFSDDPLSVCAACGGKLRKIFSPVGIVFKGSGFYRTDSRGGDVKAGAAKGGANGSAQSGGSPASDGAASTTSEPGAKAAKPGSDSGSGSSPASNGSSGSGASRPGGPAGATADSKVA